MLTISQRKKTKMINIFAKSWEMYAAIVDYSWLTAWKMIVLHTRRRRKNTPNNVDYKKATIETKKSDNRDRLLCIRHFMGTVHFNVFVALIVNGAQYIRQPINMPTYRLLLLHTPFHVCCLFFLRAIDHIFHIKFCHQRNFHFGQWILFLFSFCPPFLLDHCHI